MCIWGRLDGTPKVCRQGPRPFIFLCQTGKNQQIPAKFQLKAHAALRKTTIQFNTANLLHKNPEWWEKEGVAGSPVCALCCAVIHQGWWCVLLGSVESLMVLTRKLIKRITPTPQLFPFWSIYVSQVSGTLPVAPLLAQISRNKVTYNALRCVPLWLSLSAHYHFLVSINLGYFL